MREGHAQHLPSNIDLRADRRYTVEVGGVLQVADVPAAVYVVTVLDVSKTGLRVRCPICVPVGARVAVECCSTSIPGEVRYAREDAVDEFTLGIRATSGLRSYVVPFADSAVSLTGAVRAYPTCGQQGSRATWNSLERD